MTRAVPSEHPEQRSAPGPGRLARWLPAPGPVGPPAAAGPGERRAWRIVSVLVLVCAFLLGAAATGALLVQQGTAQERAHFEPVGQPDTDPGPAQVTVRSGGTSRVVVSERIGRVRRQPTVAERMDAGTVPLSAGCPQARMLPGCPVPPEMEIQLPPTTTVHARNGSGRTEAVGLSGSVLAETGSGRIEPTGVSGPVRARSGSGQITGTGLSTSRSQPSSASASGTVTTGRTGASRPPGPAGPAGGREWRVRKPAVGALPV
ncbi:hypothetical protein [Kitasatospora phosalacinea]|uniref:Uncharacterized protein n=1 Tax=Kitasatospora phosalacinea TaxID=2065 RepID=A0ABW6GMY9_9ACTN